LITDPLGAFEQKELSYLSAVLAGFNVTASLVVDSYGSTVNENGNSRGIGGAMDLELLKLLRRQTQIVYTSGKTARAEGEIRPKKKDLAVLSRRPSTETYGAGIGKVFNMGPLSGPDLEAHSVYQGLKILRGKDYQKIHCEFGIAGSFELLDKKALDALVISCEAGAGATKFAQDNNLDIAAQFSIEELTVLMCTGRG
jgi:hypothetical protein